MLKPPSYVVVAMFLGLFSGMATYIITRDLTSFLFTITFPLIALSLEVSLLILAALAVRLEFKKPSSRLGATKWALAASAATDLIGLSWSRQELALLIGVATWLCARHGVDLFVRTIKRHPTATLVSGLTGILWILLCGTSITGITIAFTTFICLTEAQMWALATAMFLETAVPLIVNTNPSRIVSFGFDTSDPLLLFQYGDVHQAVTASALVAMLMTLFFILVSDWDEARWRPVLISLEILSLVQIASRLSVGGISDPVGKALGMLCVLIVTIWACSGAFRSTRPQALVGIFVLLGNVGFPVWISNDSLSKPMQTLFIACMSGVFIRFVRSETRPLIVVTAVTVTGLVWVQDVSSFELADLTWGQIIMFGVVGALSAVLDRSVTWVFARGHSLPTDSGPLVRCIAMMALLIYGLLISQTATRMTDNLPWEPSARDLIGAALLCLFFWLLWRISLGCHFDILAFGAAFWLTAGSSGASLGVALFLLILGGPSTLIGRRIAPLTWKRLSVSTIMFLSLTGYCYTSGGVSQSFYIGITSLPALLLAARIEPAADLARVSLSTAILRSRAVVRDGARWGAQVTLLLALPAAFFILAVWFGKDGFARQFASELGADWFGGTIFVYSGLTIYVVTIYLLVPLWCSIGNRLLCAYVLGESSNSQDTLVEVVQRLRGGGH